ncbi:hypothetical protein KZO01_18960 [Kurthia zopfii]|uniref:Uncharacterized protein n=1 Tax=Kurthia zopfii TaxID=1650 RepID=A0A2U3AH83_9BACL|nr:hypothetical protein [Kurthia zopfii]PWI23811.1 hypothetical protein DF281_01325 [Kurthia zopfii]TDR43387.1 hypothetical protein DFR61_10267 [Kurthia zopfii]STX10640.1 Uncharacterised protein [Kurthia zopfii]VEI05986.1 Uncharacterised protein [Kurthia zopfii]GEK31587.1 hypothetical protein KZO01_18960 [Kurthia zopfii]
MIIATAILFAVFYLYQINRMTFALCERKEIPEEKQPKVYRTINILITILLVSFYVKILYAV